MSTFRKLVLFSAIAVSIASAKSYDIVLNSPMKVGSVDLTPGKYKVAVMESSMVRFTDTNGKSVETSASISNAEKKFQNTIVGTKDVNGTTSIREIDLEGTTTKLSFE